MANIQFKIPLNKGFEQDNLTSWRKVINSNRGRSKFAKKIIIED